MITDQHRQLADDIHNQLKSTTSLDRRKVENIGGIVFEVLDWLVNGEIINKKAHGYTKGQKFITYSGLDNLLNPPKENPTVIVEYKKHWTDTPIKVIGFIALVFATYFGISDS